MKRLGIDLGTNSLGWAILEGDAVKNCGVLIFEQGIPAEKGVEAPQSPAAERSAFRAARRLKFRRRLRKYHVLKLLIENRMCPLTLPELKRWISRGVFPIDNREFIAWLNSTRESNPYYFRAKAAAEKVPPLELGRALFHIAIRRGFKSSRKDQDADEKETGELKSKIAELKKILDGTGQTLGQYLYEKFRQDSRIRSAIRCGRVEHYIPEFNRICEVQGIAPELKGKLFKALFTQRPLRSQKHLVGNCILEKKSPRCLISHPLFEKYRMLAFINNITVREDGTLNARQLNSEERLFLRKLFMYKAPTFKFERLEKTLAKAFFASKSPEFNYRSDHTVGSSSLTYQLQEILQCEDLFLWRHTYTDRRGKEQVMDVQTLFDGLKYFTQDYEEEDDAFKKFARDRVGLSEENAEKLLKIKLPDGYARYSLKALRKIVRFLEMGFIERYAVYLANLPEIFGEERFAAVKEELLADFGQCVEDYNWERKNLSDRERGKCISLSERFEQLLEEKWRLTQADIARLYAFREPSNYDSLTEAEEKGIKEGRLPRIKLGMIYNPMVHRALTILRHLVNFLRKDGQIDADTEIRIELAREVNDKNSRMALLEFQKQNEKEREEAIKAFEEHGIKPTEEQILRWRLWMEQGYKCLYTGKTIPASEIFCPGENSAFDIEHTLPRSLGGDNSMENLTLCDSQYNRKIKIGNLPAECPNYDRPSPGHEKSIIDNLTSAKFYERLEKAEKDFAILCSKAKSAPLAARAAARQRALLQRFKLNYWRSKLRTFEMKRDETGDFSRRQLTATGVMSRHALQFLKSVYAKVYANSGTVTAFARQAWGLQKQYELKDRSDHVHHAIDAIVVAALDRRALERIGAAFHEDELNKYNHSALRIGYPWATFPDDVHKAVESILVRHIVRRNEMKQTQKNRVRLAAPVQLADGRTLKTVKGAGDTVRGALHDLTYYSCIRDAKGGKQIVLRVPFNADSFEKMKDFETIVDKGVREAVKTQMASLLAGGLKFKEAMSREFRMKTKSGAFDGPVIRRVRRLRPDMKNLLEIKTQTYPSKQAYKQHYYAATAKGGNFMVALYRPESVPAGEKRYVYELVSLWDWARDHRKSDYVPPQERTDKGAFVGFINPGVLVLFYKETPEELKSMPRTELQKRLYKVTEFKKNGKICLRWHREARAQTAAIAAMKKDFKCEESSKLPWEISYPLLALSPTNYQNHMLFEGIDFEMTAAGQISFKE